jgi:hypothetical protein
MVGAKGNSIVFKDVSNSDRTAAECGDLLEEHTVVEYYRDDLIPDVSFEIFRLYRGGSATHFTCQRFLQLLKTKPGKRSVALARKVMEKKHASSKKCLRHGRVFHLFSRNLYEAIGRENVRFRRVPASEGRRQHDDHLLPLLPPLARVT